MKRKRRSAEQIISKLREAEVLLQQRQAAPQVCRQLGVAAQTYYRWRKEYGGMRVDQAKRLKVPKKQIKRRRLRSGSGWVRLAWAPCSSSPEVRGRTVMSNRSMGSSGRSSSIASSSIRCWRHRS